MCTMQIMRLLLLRCMATAHKTAPANSLTRLQNYSANNTPVRCTVCALLVRLTSTDTSILQCSAMAQPQHGSCLNNCPLATTQQAVPRAAACGNNNNSGMFVALKAGPTHEKMKDLQDAHGARESHTEQGNRGNLGAAPRGQMRPLNTYHFRPEAVEF